MVPVRVLQLLLLQSLQPTVCYGEALSDPRCNNATMTILNYLSVDIRKGGHLRMFPS